MASTITTTRTIRISNETDEYFRGKPLNRIVESIAPLLKEGEMEYYEDSVRIDDDDLKELVEIITGEERDITVQVRLKENTLRELMLSGDNLSETICKRIENGRKKKDASLFIDIYHDRTNDSEEKRKVFERMKINMPMARKCMRCGKTDNVEFHHIRPLQYGGTNDMGNLTTLCEECHKEVHEYGAEQSRRVRKMLEEMGVVKENKILHEKLDVMKKLLCE